nr:MAG TPA: hypothetical protein [Caudoviricetes sp.]
MNICPISKFLHISPERSVFLRMLSSCLQFSKTMPCATWLKDLKRLKKISR